MSLPRLSRLLLDLHRAAGEVDAAAFQQQALQRLRGDVPFDSAMWASGAGTAEGPYFHAIHLHDQPMQMLADYEPLKQHDRLFGEALSQPGKSLRAASATDLPPLFQAYCARYGLAQALCTMTMDAQTALITGVSLYRSDPDHRFSDDEAAFIEAVFPHLEACDARCKLAQLGRAALPDGPTAWARAACDEKGLLRCVDEHFSRAVLAEWPQWRGPWLPDALRPVRVQAGIAVGQSSFMRVSQMGELRLVRLRARQPVDELPPRLREVAQLAARGHSHKAIATALNISPATARNQLATLYRRLGVSNRTALAAQVFGTGAGAMPSP
jgi:DNA-binding CsgD family transcriptional regulator